MNNWQWSDFSEAIIAIARERAQEAPLTGLEEMFRNRPEETTTQQLAYIADGWSRRYLTRNSDEDNCGLFLELTGGLGGEKLWALADIMVCCAVTEMRTGLSCKPTFPRGLEDIGYPVIRPIIQERWDRIHESFAKKIIRKLKTGLVTKNDAN